VQDFLLELICLNDVALLNMYMKALKPPLQRFYAFVRQKKKDKESKEKEKDPKSTKKEDTFTEEDEKLKKVFIGILEQSQQFLQKIVSWLIDSELGCLDKTV
jgi:hypothetical protein